MKKDDLENSDKKKKDESIIDVNLESLDLSISKEANMKVVHKSEYINVPKWKKKHLYSYAEIHEASAEQIKFYNYFNKKFLQNEFVDLEGNSNYAVILYFDLVDKYETHQNLNLLNEQFELLNRCCPEIKSYTKSKINELEKESMISTLLENLNLFGKPTRKKPKPTFSAFKRNNFSSENSKNPHPVKPQFNSYNPDRNKLGYKYIGKLNLNEQETKWLNKFDKPKNAFISEESCLIATSKHYILILNELDKILKTKKGSVEKEVSSFIKKIQEYHEYDSHYHSEWVDDDLIRGIESAFFLPIFRRVENSVRKRFDFARKISQVKFTYEKKFTAKYEKRVGSIVDELIEKFKDKIDPPDEKTEIVLNAKSSNRWKIKFKQLKENFEVDKKEDFYKKIDILASQNIRNTNLKNIFLETSKFITKHDKIQTLKYYVKYFHNGIKLDNFREKGLTKTAAKILFETEEQRNKFSKILYDLFHKTTDIDEALLEVPKIFIRERKKIKLNENEIQHIEKKHAGTVELLNEYLEEDETVIKQKNPETQVKTKAKKDKKPKEDAKKTNTAKSKSIFIAGLDFNEIQEKLIAKIVKNSFSIGQDEVAKIALKNNLFKNQLIDSINELCSEYLDGEALIEEDEEDYVIEEFVYKKIMIQ